MLLGVRLQAGILLTNAPGEVATKKRIHDPPTSSSTLLEDARDD